MSRSLIEQLLALQTQTLAFIAPWNEVDARAVFHPDLSPALWHIGHMAVTECYWLREAVGGEALPQNWKDDYFPERSHKSSRASRLPAKSELVAFAAGLHAGNLELLANLYAGSPRHALLARDYLPLFLIQHRLQHLELLRQIAMQRALSRDWPPFTVASPLAPRSPRPPDRRFDAQRFVLGNADGAEAYDNEQPAHEAVCRAFAVSARPVTNAEYLGFMEEGGYARQEHWSDAGWRWRQANRCDAPMHWRQDRDGNWFALEADGPVALLPDTAVHGIGRHEARAFAAYAGGRLPHEREWELAAKAGAIRPADLEAWEWCANTFYPYPDFQPFPYHGYSTPWFDGMHYVLRGASAHTGTLLRRPTFRNFYTPDKRHVFAGLRLASNLE